MMSIVAQKSNVAYGLLVNRWEWRIRGLQSNPFLNKNITTNCEKYISVRQSGKFNNGFIFIICWFNFECKDKKSADPEDLRLNTAVVLLLWNVINFWKLVFPKKKKRYVFLPLSNLIMQEFDICMTYNSLGLYA